MRQILLIIFLLVVAEGARAQTNGLARLALVSESDQLGPAADVLAAGLAGESGLQLLERNEIDKLYREQALSAGGRDLLRLGKILGADGLLLMELAPDRDGPVLAIRLVAARPGVVLASERFPWPMKDLASWVDGMVARVRREAPKLSVLQKDAIPISILNFRSGIQSEAARDLERQLSVLAAGRLGRERRLFVVERRRTQLLATENELNGLDDSTFWTGSYLLDGTIDATGYSEAAMTVNARLQGPNGGAAIPIAFTCPRTNLMAAADLLAGKVVAALKLEENAPAWHPEAEAAQYSKEAAWAFRWELFPAAQDASEAAWALGGRTPEVARLRIRAYAESVLGGRFDDTDVPLAVDPEALGVLRRAMELYTRAISVEFPNVITADQDWFLAGLQVFHRASAAVSAFHRAVELREGHEAELAEFRQTTRQFEELLEAKIPPGQLADNPELTKTVLRTNLYGSTWGVPQKDLVEKYNRARWEQGGAFFEHPGDAAPLFRRMIEEGYHPKGAPGFAGWSWSERKRIPGITATFIHDLCAATNPAVRLEGFYLAMVTAGAGAETGLQPGEDELLRAIALSKERIMRVPGTASVLNRSRDFLKGSYATRSTNPAAESAFNDLAFKIAREFLVNAGKADLAVFEEMFRDFNPLDPSQAEAEELLPLLDDLGRRTESNWSVMDVARTYRRKYNLTGGIPAPAPAARVLPAETPMVVRFLKWNLDDHGGSADVGLSPRSMIFRNNRLWARLCNLSGEFVSQPAAPATYVSVDPRTGNCESIPFPAERGLTDPSFDVTEDSLYVSARDHIDRYRFATRQWETISAPIENGAQLAVVGHRVFLATRDDLLDLNLDSHQTTVAASRRREPLNPMDTNWNADEKIFTRDDGKLGVILGGRAFAYAPANGTWEQPGRLPLEVEKRHNNDAFSTGRGAVIFVGGDRPPNLLMALWNNETNPTLLLQWEHVKDDPFPPGSAVWDWPEPFRMDFPCITAQGNGLWIIYPCKRPPYVGVRSGPIEYRDDRDSTLMAFEPGKREPALVPLRFENEGRAYSPFDHLNVFPRHHGLPANPMWCSTPDGLALACPQLAGHWLIPTTELEPQLRAARAAAKETQKASEPGKMTPSR